MKRLMIMLAAVVAMVMSAACDEYDGVLPDSNILAQFNAMYPGAKDVEWEREGYYWKVSFETGRDRVDREAWFDKNGDWLKTETDLHLSSVPQYIKDYLDGSIYKDASFEDGDAEYIETPSGNYYRFELLFGGIEIKVKVFEDGRVGIEGIER